MPPEINDRILNARAVLLMTSLSRTTIWRLCKRGEFPQPIKLTSARSGWSLRAIEAWLASRAANDDERLTRRSA